VRGKTILKSQPEACQFAQRDRIATDKTQEPQSRANAGARTRSEQKPHLLCPGHVGAEIGIWPIISAIARHLA